MGERVPWPQTGEMLPDGRVALHVGNIWTDLHAGDDIGEIVWQSKGPRHSRALTREQCLRVLRLAETDAPSSHLGSVGRKAAKRIIGKMHRCLRAFDGS